MVVQTATMQQMGIEQLCSSTLCTTSYRHC